MQRLTRPVRRAQLVLHVTVSVGWLGITLCLLTLGIAGAATDSAATAEAAYRSMKIFSDWLLVPVALITLLSGLVLSLGTHWGLARHRWVWTKFWITLAAAAATVLAFRATVDDAAAQVASGGTVAGATLVVPPSVSLGAYLFTTALSVLKPWGLTRRGQRHREAENAARGSVRDRARTVVGPDGRTPGQPSPLRDHT